MGRICMEGRRWLEILIQEIGNDLRKKKVKNNQYLFQPMCIKYVTKIKENLGPNTRLMAVFTKLQ